MSRKPRLHYNGAIYHVTARGNNRQIIFNDEYDKTYYQMLLKHYKEKFACSLYAYVLMDNHVHLLVQVANQPVSKFMQGIQQCYTMHYNQKYSHVGHVFQQRYNAELCDNDSYLLSVVRYIRNNPVKAKIVDALDYSWSSHNDYVQGDCSFIDSSAILGMFADERNMAIERYLTFMKEIEEEPPISSGDRSDIAEIPEHSVVPKLSNFSLENLLDQVVSEMGIETKDIVSGSKAREVVIARRKFIYLALQRGLVTGVDLARFLNVSQSQISRGYKEYIASL